MAVPWSAAADDVATAGTAVSVSISGLPAAGDVGLCVVSINSGSATVSTPSGWTLVDGPQTVTGSTCRSYLFTRTMDGTETSISCTVSASFRWSIIAAGSPGTFDGYAFAQDNTNATVMTLPAYTPVAANCLAVGMAGMGGVTGNTAQSVTPPLVFTEVQDQNTVSPAGVNMLSWVGYRQLVGQAGTGQTSATGTVAGTPNGNHRGNAWVVTIAPPVVTNTGAFFALM